MTGIYNLHPDLWHALRQAALGNFYEEDRSDREINSADEAIIGAIAVMRVMATMGQEKFLAAVGGPMVSGSLEQAPEPNEQGFTIRHEEDWTQHLKDHADHLAERIGAFKALPNDASDRDHYLLIDGLHSILAAFREMLQIHNAQLLAKAKAISPKHGIWVPLIRDLEPSGIEGSKLHFDPKPFDDEGKPQFSIARGDDWQLMQHAAADRYEKAIRAVTGMPTGSNHMAWGEAVREMRAAEKLFGEAILMLDKRRRPEAYQCPPTE